MTEIPRRKREMNDEGIYKAVHSYTDIYICMSSEFSTKKIMYWKYTQLLLL